MLRVTRVRVKGELPASYALAVLPLARFPGLTADSDAHEDIVALGRAHGVPLGRATEDADTAYPAADVAEYLGVDPDEEVLKLERIVRSRGDCPLSGGWHTFVWIRTVSTVDRLIRAISLVRSIAPA